MLDELKGQKRIVGVKQSTKAVECGSVLRAFVAQDADEDVIVPFENVCGKNNVPVTRVESKRVLGEACGIDVCAAVAVVVK